MAWSFDLDMYNIFQSFHYFPGRLLKLPWLTIIAGSLEAASWLSWVPERFGEYALAP